MEAVDEQSPWLWEKGEPQHERNEPVSQQVD
jgi:hypothetical protein